MRKFIILLFTLFSTSLFFGQEVFISEINYTGTSKGIRLTGSGTTDLDGWKLVFYKRTSGKEYNKIDEVTLNGTLKNNDIWFSIPEMSNVHVNGLGVALIKKNGDPVELIGYNGPDEVFTVKKGEAAFGETSIYAGTTTGEFSIQRTSATGGWDTSNPPINSKTASVTKNQIEDFNLYPNPVREGLFTISTKNSFDKHVLIYSISGRVVYEKTIRSNELVNVQNLSVGMYMVQVEENEKVSLKKLLIN
ncbi:T9SS type A sorting domain-containing protein [Lutibacter citreus]|uniref:T9SS type A sorting domain-containing protein n=1 Tax=Lutibacter citreus TaxID=2138210 RepID=UPI000DBE17CE|nr:T9SS type A sorting domain-containing protein [Lutibacter citreus]